MKICYVSSKSAESHHAKFSGYSGLMKFCKVENDCVSANQNKNSKLLKICKKIGTKIGLPKWYAMQYYEPSLILRNFDILHHIYGEDTYLFTSFFKKKKTVVTYHQPPNIFLEVMPSYWKYLAEQADVIITLSNDQKDFFKKQISTRVEFIPHGVDFDRIRSSIQYTTERFNSKICLSVGSWLRDYKLLAETINKVDDPEITFFIVTSENHEQEINKILLPEKKSIVRIFKNISDAELLNLYSKCSLFILPLKNGTINNALLEAMSAGLPILATGDYVPVDYLIYNCALIEKPNPELAAKSIVNLLNNPSILNKMGMESLKNAESFSWEKVIKKIDDLYFDITQ